MTMVIGVKLPEQLGFRVQGCLMGLSRLAFVFEAFRPHACVPAGKPKAAASVAMSHACVAAGHICVFSAMEDTLEIISYVSSSMCLIFVT